MLSPNAMNLVKRSLGSGGVIVIENEQALASVGWSAVHVAEDMPIGNAVPETGEQVLLSTGMPATVGRFQLSVTGRASTDCRSTEGGQDMRAALGVPGFVAVGAGGELSSPQPSVRTARRSAVRRSVSSTYPQSCRRLLGGRPPPVGTPHVPSSGQTKR